MYTQKISRIIINHYRKNIYMLIFRDNMLILGMERLFENVKCINT